MNGKSLKSLMKTMKLLSFLMMPVLVLSGCASVNVTPLNANGTPNKKAADGIRYYLPLPYLLVVELPPTLVTNGASPASDDQNLSEDDANIAASGGGSKPKPPASGNTTNQSSSSAMTSPAPASDVSFSAATPQYMIKLIYLPDLQHPMAMTESAGIGTADMKPNLQDGWMLTSLDAPIDSKASENITAVGSLLSSVASGFVKALVVNHGGQPPSIPPSLETYYTGKNSILRPGLYRFVYDKKGVLTGLAPVTIFKGNMTPGHSD
jgi:uncharacterized protein YceK